MNETDIVFDRVYSSSIATLTAMSFSELHRLQHKISDEIRQAKLRRFWLEGAVQKKSQNEQAIKGE